jgi:2'-5' RNA ligase
MPKEEEDGGLMRLFVAVTPPDEVLSLVESLPRPGVVGVRWTTRPQWHVTLRFLGRVDDALVDDVVAALASASVPDPVVATLGPAVARFAHRVLQVPVEGLSALAAQVVDVTAAFGEPPEDRPFKGHLTLARVGRGAGRVDLRPLSGAPITATWPVSSFELYSSELHPHGARYTVVSSFPLAT